MSLCWPETLLEEKKRKKGFKAQTAILIKKNKTIYLDLKTNIIKAVRVQAFPCPLPDQYQSEEERKKPIITIKVSSN